MPPRRSCLGSLVLPDLRRAAFQCHHGVPAFVARPPKSPLRSRVSMPPRRSCFHRRRPGPGPHRLGFNATTAFLLSHRHPAVRKVPALFQCHHGVPASMRRSPLPASRIQVSMPPRRSCFDTGSPERDRGATVSMPPRRSCFVISPRSPWAG